MPFLPDTPLVGEIVPSPNHGARKSAISILLLHYTGMANGPSAIRWLANPQSQVSCHYVVNEDGRIVQMVPESLRAWHAGAGGWRGRTDINSASIGIEIVNRGHDFDYPDFPEPQIAAVIALCRDILARHDIAARDVLAHSDTAPPRKRDPGEKFPWPLLHEAGIGHHVPPAAIGGGRFFSRGESGPPVRALQEMFALYGYEIALTGEFDLATEHVVRAFQRHFRPALVDGIADVSTITTLRDLIAALPPQTPPA